MNNGIMGKSSVKARIFDSNTITIDMFGNTYFRDFNYKMVTHARVFSLKFIEKELKIYEGLYITAQLYYLRYLFEYNNMASWKKVKKLKIKLPYKNNKIDFDFMNSFISELEEERINELVTYLTVSGLDNYELSSEEKKFINYIDNSSNNVEQLINDKLKSVNWKEYKMSDLFDRITTNKLPYKAKELPNCVTGKYVLPCLTSSFMNQGLNYYAPKENATILKNVISIPSNSDVYRAYFQSEEFTVLSDAYAIRWKDSRMHITENQYLFMVLCINKVTDLPIYSYKNKLGGWNKVKNKKILLPQTNGEIDFSFMEKIVSITKKIAIKNVVLWKNKVIEKTEDRI